MAWITAELVDDGVGTGAGPNPAWTKPDTTPGAHAGWNNRAGDDVWVPDQSYYKRVLLTLWDTDAAPGPGDKMVSSAVNWELYDLSVYWVAPDASIQVNTHPNTGGRKDQVYAIAIDTGKFYISPGVAQAWVEVTEDEFPSPVPTLRANGPRVVVNLPIYFKWGSAEDVDFLVDAFASGSFGTPSDALILTDIASPDEGLITP